MNDAEKSALASNVSGEIADPSTCYKPHYRQILNFGRKQVKWIKIHQDYAAMLVQDSNNIYTYPRHTIINS